MAKLGVLVGEDRWSFFREIHEELTQHYTTTIFQRKSYAVPFFYNKINATLYFRALRRTLQQNDLCFFEWASDLLMHASRMPKTCKVVTRLHSFELFEWAPQINWNFVDRVILVSEFMRQRFVEYYPQHAQKAVVVFNGRPLELFQPVVHGPFQFNLGMVCSISPIKRVYETVLMFHQLQADGYAARLYIAGEPAGDHRYALAVERLVKHLGLQDHIFFEGQISDIPSWLQKIDIFISNSFWEGQQVALLEAMAAGCYCLSHFWAGAEEMLPTANLFVTEAELRQQIVAYAGLPHYEQQQLQAQLRTLACERFDIQQTKVQIRQIVREVLAESL
jgi:glycosyltransferase involved in cell wall biosynthesis